LTINYVKRKVELNFPQMRWETEYIFLLKGVELWQDFQEQRQRLWHWHRQWIKEGKYALKWTRLSCHDFVDNQVRLQLFAMAYNMGNSLRRLALPNQIKDWSLRTMREKLVKIGAKVVSHGRYVTFQMTVLLVSKFLFHKSFERINHLKPAPIRSYRNLY